MNLPTPEELKAKLSIEQQNDEIVLRTYYNKWLKDEVIPKLTPEGCEGSWKSFALHKNWEKINSWLGEKGWTIKTREVTPNSIYGDHENSVYNYYKVMPIIYPQEKS